MGIASKKLSAEELQSMPEILSGKREVMKLHKEASMQGSAKAQYELGLLFKQGFKVSQDYTRAMYWTEKAASQGLVGAQYEMGWFYYSGCGVKRNYKKALPWLILAADQGHARAQCALGMCCFNGWGMESSNSEAIIWFSKSAAQGNQDAIMMALHLHQIGFFAPRLKSSQANQ